MSIVLVKKMFVFCECCFDNQCHIYKSSCVPDVSLTIRTLETVQDYYFEANYIKIFARCLKIFKPLTLNAYMIYLNRIYYIYIYSGESDELPKKKRSRSLQAGA